MSQASILHYVELNHPGFRYDYMLPETVCGRIQKNFLPTWEEWIAEAVIGDGDITIVTDGSKLQCKAGSEVYSGKLVLNGSYKLPNQASIFQAELFAIERMAYLFRT